MKLQRFLSKTRIIDLTNLEFDKALSELLATVPDSALGSANRKDILADLIEREKAISTYLGNGICMPHTRVKGLKNNYVFAVGRCPNGVKLDSVEEYKKTRMLFLLLADDKVDSYLNVLSSLARALSNESTISKIVNSTDIQGFRNEILAAFEKNETAPSKTSAVKKISMPERKRVAKETKINALIARSALKISKVAQCTATLLQVDTFSDVNELSKYFGDTKIVAMSERSSLKLPDKWNFINVRAFSSERFSQLKSAIIIGLTRGIFSPKDKICCVGGVRESNQIDSIVVLDIGREFSDIFLSQKNMLPEGVKPEVLERVIDIATELSVEGREGKPVGCIFVIGNIENLKPHLKQLILNPFYGYKPEDRNILNPFMDETVKEYSLIDGAFIIDGSGILDAAGALIHTPDFKLQLPGGLGARHAAAYAISLMADCMSLVVSSSTGQITLFRRGQMLPITEKRKK